MNLQSLIAKLRKQFPDLNTPVRGRHLVWILEEMLAEELAEEEAEEKRLSSIIDEIEGLPG